MRYVLDWLQLPPSVTLPARTEAGSTAPKRARAERIMVGGRRMEKGLLRALRGAVGRYERNTHLAIVCGRRRWKKECSANNTRWSSPSLRKRSRSLFVCPAKAGPLSAPFSHTPELARDSGKISISCCAMTQEHA